MKNEGLNDLFIKELQERFNRNADLINYLVEILNIEREAAYRRVTGKVCCSANEMGKICRELNISLDGLLFADKDFNSLPVTLEKPITYLSIDSICDKIDDCIGMLKYMTLSSTSRVEYGCLSHRMPYEFIYHSPLMWKFFCFMLGHTFVRSENFNHFSSWQVPARLAAIPLSYPDIFRFGSCLYIWDSNIVWNFCKDLNLLQDMLVITDNEKEAIKDELRMILSNIEHTLNGTRTPEINLPEEAEFYVAQNNIGSTSIYCGSDESNYSSVETNYSYTVTKNNPRVFSGVREWMHSFKPICMLISGSGRTARRIFFESQYRIIENA